MNNPEYDPVKSSEALQRLVERMGKAKWLVGMQLVSPDKDDLQFSVLGRKQMNKAYDAVIEKCPDAFKDLEAYRLSKEGGEKEKLSELVKSAVSSLNLLPGVISIRVALEPPPFSSDEVVSLIGLMIAFARQRAKSQGLATKLAGSNMAVAKSSSSGELVILILLTVLLPIIGLIVGIVRISNPQRRNEGGILLLIALCLMIIYAILLSQM
jgi:hypothetical protein